MTPQVTRRDFLKLGAAGLASAVLAGCQSPRRWVELEPYVRPPEEQLAGVATWYASTCCQCPAGCGIVVRVMNGRALKIEGNSEHPLNRGKLCARGQAGLQLLYHPDRLPAPLSQALRGSREFQSLAWEEALNVLYAKLGAAGSAVAVWAGSTTSSHLLDLFGRYTRAVGAPKPIIFDLYTALHGYHNLAGDTGMLPTYDLAHADVVFSFGADLLGTGLSAVRYGVEYGDFRGQPLGKRGYLVQLEPRLSTTAAVADRWLPVRPGSEGLVAWALLRLIADEALGSAERVAQARALAGAATTPSGQALSVSDVAGASELSADDLRELARLWATAPRPMAIPGGTLDEEAITAVQALNAVTGAGQLSPAAPLDTPTVSAFDDVQALIARMKAGEIRVLLVHGANPVYDLPPVAGLLDALGKVPTVVSFSPLVDETGVQADLILPDRTYLESWGYEVVSPGFDLPVIGSRQPVVQPVFDARATADVLLTVVRGIPAAAAALPWTDEVAYLKETVAQLPPGAAAGSGADVLWARFLQHGGWWPAEEPAASRIPAPSGLVKVSAPAVKTDASQYPYVLHLYTTPLLGAGQMASLPWLQGCPDPMTTLAWQTWVELHPSTAQKLGVADGDVVRLTSPDGELEAPVYVYPAIRPDTIAMPAGQGHSDAGRYARGRGVNPMALVGADLNWASLRVQLSPTGRRMAMARFESRVGVTEGFINQSFPDQ